MASEKNIISERKRNAVWGAAVADAASMGLHWIYDQDRIKEIAPESPEFHLPNKVNYENVPGYFAHANRLDGQCSHYGEQMLTLLRSLAINGHRYDQAHYQSCFVEHFGYGGSYVGYIDHPTYDTLKNINTAEKEAINIAESLPFDGDEVLKRKLITKVLGGMKQNSGEALRKQIEKAVRVTDDDDALVDHALHMAKIINERTDFSGADDTQLPAISKLPALVAEYFDSPELSIHVNSAVRVTNDNDEAVAFAQVASKLLSVAISTGDIDQVIKAAIAEDDSIVKPLITEAILKSDQTTIDVTHEWGMSCNLSFGFPSIIHNLSKKRTFTDSIRENIYAGGDSCGRSIILGAILGACLGRGSYQGHENDQGIPEVWIQKLSSATDIEAWLT